VLLPCITEPDGVRQLAERIIVSLQRPIIIDGREHQVSASIGMTVFPADGTKLGDLLKAGDIAMYQAKDAAADVLCSFRRKCSKSCWPGSCWRPACTAP